MKRTVIFVVMALLVASVTVKADFTTQEWERMKKGEVIVTEVAGQNPDGSQRVEFQGKIYIKADRQTAWKFLRDYDKFAEFMPNLQVCKITKKEGEAFYVHYQTKVMVVNVQYDLIVVGEPFKRITFKLDTAKKHDIRDTSGYWLLEDAPDGSGVILTYTLFIDTGIPAPEAVAKSAAKKSLPNVLNNMRNRIQSGGAWKKPQGT